LDSRADAKVKETEIKAITAITVAIFSVFTLGSSELCIHLALSIYDFSKISPQYQLTSMERELKTGSFCPCK
jgi:hypothetical protein